MVLTMVLSLVSCGPSFNGRIFDGKGVRFVAGEQPPAWRGIEADGTLLTFRDDEHDATIGVNGRCGKDAEDVPLVALTQHLFLQFTERKVTDQQVVAMDGREAMRTTLTAKLDGVERAFAIYVLKKDGCVWDFLYVSRPQSFSSEVRKFDQFVAGFHALTSHVGGD
jgi:hypothetical protein